MNRGWAHDYRTPLASRWSRACSDVRVYLRWVEGSGQRDHPGGPVRRDESSPRARDDAAAATVKGAMPGPRVWLIHALEGEEHRNNDVDRVATDPIFHP